MRLLTSAVAFIAAAKAQDNTDLAPECPVQPSCGCSPEDVEAWEGRIARWEGEMDRWETSMQEWRDRQAAKAQVCGSTTVSPPTDPPATDAPPGTTTTAPTNPPATDPPATDP